MDLGFSTGLYGELGVAENLVKSKQLDFQCYQTGAWSLLKRDKFDGGRTVSQRHLDDTELVDEIGRAIAETGVYICCIHGPVPGVKLGGPDFDDKLPLYRVLLERMQKLGIKFLLHHAGNKNLGDFREGANQAMWDAIAGSIIKLRDIAAKYEVELTIETGAGAQDLAHPEAMRRLFDEVEGLHWSIDVHHAYRPGLWTYEECFEALGHKLVNMHVPDGEGFMGHGGIPGKCAIDWDLVMRLVRETGFDGPASIETDLRALEYILGYYLGMMKEENVRQARMAPISYFAPNEYRYGNRIEGNTKLTPSFIKMPSATITLTDDEQNVPDMRDVVITTARKHLEQFWANSAESDLDATAK